MYTFFSLPFFIINIFNNNLTLPQKYFHYWNVKLILPPICSLRGPGGPLGLHLNNKNSGKHIIRVIIIYFFAKNKCLFMVWSREKLDQPNMTSEMQYTGLWDIHKSQLAYAFMIKNPPAQPTRVCMQHRSI